MKYEYHCIYCNNHWEEEREPEYKNAPCVMPCPKCRDYGVNRVRPYVKSIKLNSRICDKDENSCISTDRGDR